MNKINANLRALPSIDLVLRELGDLIDHHGRKQVTDTARIVLEEMRTNISSGIEDYGQDYLECISAMVTEKITVAARRSFISVFNLTGTVLHTNLGRALLPDIALEAVAQVSRSACNLEYDLEQGKRGDRDKHVEQLLCKLTGAEAATVVNNNAAAVLLTLNTLGKHKEVPVSRGELVEIGGSFRMPEIITSAGCSLVEVGTTNRTHLKDYSRVINDKTAMLLKVHTSNYRIEGFVSKVKENELATLARQHGLPFVIDLGSGNLIDFKIFDLPDEPTVGQALDCGADLVTFSGDKLLGGPQCGIIAGKKTLVAQIKNNPLKRALRPGKMILAALAEVLRLYQDPTQLVQTLPTMTYLGRSLDAIRDLALRILDNVGSALPESFSVTATSCVSQVGSGALPMASIPSYGLAISTSDNSDQRLRQLVSAMRQLPIPVIGRIHNGKFLLDLRCLDNEDKFLAQLKQLPGLLA